ncbi:DUF3896 family protein [Bacillus cereus]
MKHTYDYHATKKAFRIKETKLM